MRSGAKGKEAGDKRVGSAGYPAPGSGSDTQRQAQAEPGRRGAARLGGSGSERGKQSMKRDRRETGSTGSRDEESDGSKTKSMAMPP